MSVVIYRASIDLHSNWLLSDLLSELPLHQHIPALGGQDITVVQPPDKYNPSTHHWVLTVPFISSPWSLLTLRKPSAGLNSPRFGDCCRVAASEANTWSRAASPDHPLEFWPPCHSKERCGRRAVCVSFEYVPITSFFITMSFVQSKTTWICSPKLYLPITCVCQDGNYQGLNFHPQKEVPGSKGCPQLWISKWWRHLWETSIWVPIISLIFPNSDHWDLTPQHILLSLSSGFSLSLIVVSALFLVVKLFL